MESWLQRVFLAALLTASAPALTQEQEPQEREPLRRETPSEGDAALDTIIDPGLDRRQIWEDQIDTENWEVGLFGGVMNVEDFGSNDVYGVRLAYHLTEDFFLESLYGQTETSETSWERLTNTQLFDDHQRRLRYIDLSLGYNILPGEVFIGDYAFNTNYYFIGGVGTTLWADNEYLTYNFGGGFRFFATDWLALRVDFRAHHFSHRLLSEDDKKIQNLEGHLGMTIFF